MPREKQNKTRPKGSDFNKISKSFNMNASILPKLYQNSMQAAYQLLLILDVPHFQFFR